MHYRFNCADETFVVVERQIMGANEEVVARDDPNKSIACTRQPAARAACCRSPAAALRRYRCCCGRW
jgi:hypothetical protein